MLARSECEIAARLRAQERCDDGRHARVERDRVMCEPGGVVTRRDRMIDRELGEVAIVIGSIGVRVVAVIDDGAAGVVRVVVVVMREVERREALDADQPRDARDQREQSMATTRSPHREELRPCRSTGSSVGMCR